MPRQHVPLGSRVLRTSDATLLRTAQASYADVPVPDRVGVRRVDVRVFGHAGGPLKTSCKDANLAALDRLALAFYGQSLRAGNPTKRAALLVSRNSLLGRLETCRSEPCLRGAYLTHLREIAAIVESKSTP